MTPPLSPSPVQNERRAESPAPLIGNDETSESYSRLAPGESAAAASDQAAAVKAAAPKLEATASLDASGAGSSAVAAVAKPEEGKPVVKGSAEKVLAVKRAAPAGSGAIASVHYGATSRSELMSRAAGPVYNVMGASKSGRAVEQSVSVNMNAQIVELKKQLESIKLTPEQRESILKQLEAAGKSIP
jgi:hypothetical protein